MNTVLERIKHIRSKLSVKDTDKVLISRISIDPHNFKPFLKVLVNSDHYEYDIESDNIVKIEVKNKLSLDYYKFNEYELKTFFTPPDSLMSIPSYRTLTEEEIEALGFIYQPQPVLLDVPTNEVLVAKSRKFENLEKFIEYANTHSNNYCIYIGIHVFGSVITRLFYKSEIHKLQPVDEPKFPKNE